MILVVDTSTKYIGLAVFDGNQILGEQIWLSENYHTIELAQAVDLLMKRIGLQPVDFTVLGAATGPGSFTGLRIGLAFVKGLSYTHQIPIVGIPTLDISARGIPVEEGTLVAVLEAGRGRYAAGWYEPDGHHWQATGKIENLSAEQLLASLSGQELITGEISSSLRAKLENWKEISLADPAQALRSPKYLADLAWKRWMDSEVDPPETLVPFYLHKGDPIPG